MNKKREEKALGNSVLSPKLFDFKWEMQRRIILFTCFKKML